MVLSTLNRLTGNHFGASGPANEILTECIRLRNLYASRQQSFRVWYDLLMLKDSLAQANMESFVGNDPRTTWNMAVYLLTPKPLVHQVVSTEGLPMSPATREAAHLVQQYFGRLWSRINQQNIYAGQPSWFSNFVGLLTITGWYALPYLMLPDGKPFVDYWNPATVFPEFEYSSNRELIKLARIRKLSASQAVAIAKAEGWAYNFTSRMGNSVTEYQLWVKDVDSIHHGVVFDNTVVKSLAPVSGLTRIPVLVGYVGGLPDDGAIDTDYMKSQGQAVIAPNEPLFINYNKQQTFLQQLARDTANPRVFEKSAGNRPIIANIDEWYKRGAHFRGGPNDSIDVLQPPGIPVELTQLLFTIRNQMQRAGFNDLVFGNILQEVPVSMIAQAAESAMQLIEPYYNAVKIITSEITDFWYQIYLKNPTIMPASWKGFDTEALENTHIVSDYAVKIPGDLQTRIATARSLNPRFEVPLPKVYELTLPEITSPIEAIAQLEGERAKLHPSYQAVQLIAAFEEAALEARRFNNPQFAKLFETVAANMRRQLGQTNLPQDKLPANGQEGEAGGILPSLSALRMGVK